MWKWPFSSRSIRTKVGLYVLILLVATTSIFYVITLRIMNDYIMTEVIKRGESLSRSIASAAGYSLLSQDLLGLDNMVYKIKRTNPDVNFIAIRGRDNTIIVHSDIRKAGGQLAPTGGLVITRSQDRTFVREVPSVFESHFEIESPVIFMKKALGSVIVSLDRSILTSAQSEARHKMIWFFAAILAAGIAGVVLLSSNLTAPIKELMAGVEGLKRGQGGRPLRVYSGDELGRLTASFNEMAGLITEQRDKLGKYADDLEESYISTIRVLAAAIDARDGYTLGHSTRVSELAVGLAREVGLSRPEVEEIEIACLFHDVGKIKIPDSILHKRGRLTQAEYKEMQKHPGYGAEILSKAPSLYRFIPAVRHHHEWFNGAGYPDGLSREKIPLAAAIISLADAYDAITSDRPYRSAMSKEEALREIEACSGRQFNPDLVPAFLKLMLDNRAPGQTTPPEGTNP